MSLVEAAYRGVMGGAALAAGVAAAVPGLPVGWRAAGDRLGRLDAGERAAASSMPALWMHAASVGELTAVRPLLGALRERFPGRLAVVTTLTRTGLALARTLPEAHLAFLFPLDAPGPVARVLDTLRVEAFLFTETEIWPTTLAALAARRIPALMVSGRVSARTAARARFLRPLFAPALETVTCCMQTPEDAARVVTLGADPRRVQVAGSLKFEVAGTPPPPAVEALRARLLDRPVLVAGSTHEGEEEVLLDVAQRLALGHPGLVLVLAPRHPERLERVAAQVRARGLALLRWSRLESDALPEAAAGVVLLDEMGVLAHAYALGRVAFVGGSLVPVGGHNVLEPARASRPVVVGPHTANAADAVDRLVAAGGAMRAASADGLALALDHLLGDPARAREMGRRAWGAAQTGQGALERHLKIIAARLESATFARAASG
ncbi:MAG: 3-deoxy-D-manno-octulosonic acid transferase [bacterium]|nr:3-deoxy-D-manno-octulosonic acid transferase [bacterium]